MMIMDSKVSILVRLKQQNCVYRSWNIVENVKLNWSMVKTSAGCFPNVFMNCMVGFGSS
jgi:hypothetical protein